MIRTKLRVVSRLSHWLSRHRLGIPDMHGNCLKRFLAYRRRTHRYIRGDAAAVRDIEMLLQSAGLIDSHEWPVATEEERIVEGYRVYLAQDRGLTAATVRCYLPFVSRFLHACFADGPVRLAALTRTDVTAFFNTMRMTIATPGLC